MKLNKFISKYVIEGHDFCVFCPNLSPTLYDKEDLFKADMSRDVDSLCIFDYMIVDSVCVNGSIQINCHFQHRKWCKDVKILEASDLDSESNFKQLCLEDYFDDTF